MELGLVSMASTAATQSCALVKTAVQKVLEICTIYTFWIINETMLMIYPRTLDIRTSSECSDQNNYEDISPNNS